MKVTVAPQSWPDYVFDDAYKLSSLDEVEHYIKINRHLPDMPAAAVVEKEGHDLGEMDRKLLQKVEELTLYLLEVNRQNRELKAEIETLKNKINNL